MKDFSSFFFFVINIVAIEIAKINWLLLERKIPSRRKRKIINKQNFQENEKCKYLDAIVAIKMNVR